MHDCFGHSVLGRSTGRLEQEMLLKFQVVFSPGPLAPGRSKTGTCERGLRGYNGRHTNIYTRHLRTQKNKSVPNIVTQMLSQYAKKRYYI